MNVLQNIASCSGQANLNCNETRIRQRKKITQRKRRESGFAMLLVFFLLL
jgi:hypothetical protein